MNYKIKIIAVDPTKLPPEANRLFIDKNDNFELIDHVASFQPIKDILSVLKPNILLVNADVLSSENIIDCLDVLSKYPQIKCIVFNFGLSQLDSKKAAKFKAHKTLDKNASAQDFKFAIKEVLEQKQQSSIETTKKLKTNINATNASKFPLLSKREKEILKFLISEKNKQEISDLLFITKGTVETHCQNIMRKLGTDNTKSTIKFVLENRLL